MKNPISIVALTGATGFLGGHIATALLDAGFQVRALVRNPARAGHLIAQGVEVVCADLTALKSLEYGLSGVNAVVSNASLGSWAGSAADSTAAYDRVNVQGISNLFTAAQRVGVPRVVMISSVAVYRTKLWRSMTEDAAVYDTERRRLNWSDLTTDWRYARSKTRAEAIARDFSADLTILRPGPIYGSADPKLTGRYLSAARRRLVFAPTVGVPQVHAADVAGAVVAALRNRQSIGRAYTLAAPPTSPWQTVRLLRKLLLSQDHAGVSPVPQTSVVIPIPLPIWVHYDCSAARRDLGFNPRSLEDGLRQVVAAEVHHVD